MSSSNVWVNQEYVDQKKIKKRNKKNKKIRYYAAREKVNTAKEAPNTINKVTKASHEYTQKVNEGNPTLFDALGKLSAMAQKLDLVKIRNQLTEINQIVDQVNGVIKGFQDQRPYTQQSPMHQQHNYGVQPPYYKQHPYSSYRPR